MQKNSASTPRRARAAGVIATALLVAAGASSSAQQQGQHITPNFRDADITQLIDLVSQATGRNFIIAPGVHAQVTWLSGPGTSMTPGVRVEVRAPAAKP